MALIGLVALRDLPVAATPRVDIPTILVTASQPGADPETMASSIAAPLERRLGAIAGVTELTSYSSLGSSTIVVQIDLSRSQADAARDVQAAVNAARQDLPSGLPNPPTVRKINPADAPVMSLAMFSDTLAATAVYDVADTLVAQRLAQVRGVAQVAVSGGDQPAVRVAVDPNAAAAAGIGLDAVRQAITSANVTQPIGAIEGAQQAATLLTNDRLTRAEEFGRIVVKSSGNGGVVRLSSIGRVSDSTRSRRQAGWYNRRPAIVLNVYKQADANVIEVVDSVRAMLPQIHEWLPGGVSLQPVSDRSATIRASVEEVELTLAVTIVLVVLVVAAFLRRPAPVLAASAAVPLSLLGTLAVMWLLGYSLNNLTLMALTISVGFVVDDAIVMIENMSRLRERGVPPLEAALQGAREIGFTVLSITLSLIAVFVPLLAMGGLIGRIFREFSVTLAVAVALSGVISLTLTPMVAARMDRGEASRSPGRLARTFEASLDSLVRGYMRSLGWMMRFRRSVLLLTVALAGLTVWLYVVVPKGFFPEQDTGLLAGVTIAAPDTSFEVMYRLHRQASDIILADPAVESLTASIGGSFGGGTSNRGQMFMALKPRAERDASAAQVIDRLRRPLGAIPGTQVFLRVQQDLFIGGRQGNAQFQYVLLGTDLAELRQWTQAMVDKLRTLEGLADVSSDQERAGLVTRLIIDRDMAARLGVQVSAINSVLNNAYSQRQVSTIYAARNQYRVVIEVEAVLQHDASQLNALFVPGSGGAQVPLGAVARVERTTAPQQVTHQGQFPAATITFNLPEGVSLGQAQELVRGAERDVQMPATVRTQFGGNAAAFQSFARDQPLLILGALLTIYVVLGVLYESYVHPLTILSSLPAAGLGGLLALFATGTDLSVIALIGIILLLGIVKKNAIMLVDFALEHERKERLGSEAAILAACHDRFRPILMTTLAALLGAVPLAIGGGTGAELRQPLGITIIGGLALSQVLTLYTTPVVYLTLDRFRRRRAPMRSGEISRHILSVGP